MTGQLAFDLAAAQNGSPARPRSANGTRPHSSWARCEQCAGPIPPGKKSTTLYCSRGCKDRADAARNAERDHANGACQEPRRCECDRPLLILDDALAETRCMRCGRVR